MPFSQIPVICIIRAWIENSDHNEHMLKVRSNVLWCEWKCTRLLEHNSDYVIANVSFSEKLQQNGEHHSMLLLTITVKFRKISPGASFFQRPFSRGLFLEGFIFGGAYPGREICVSKSIGLAYSWKEIYRFFFAFLCIRGQFPSTSPPRGAYIWRGDLTEVFLRYEFGGLILGGAYFRNFTVPKSIALEEIQRKHV